MPFADIAVPDSLHSTFNYTEAAFWSLIGIGFAARALLKRSGKLLVPALLFLVFGITDLIEVQTGAWWRPLGLLVAKVATVCGLGICLFRHSQEARRDRVRDSKSAEGGRFHK